MPPAAVPGAPAPPPASRTKLELVAAVGSDPAQFRAAADSPMVKALKFLGWGDSGSAGKVVAPRHEVAGALLMQSRVPLAADLSTLDGYSILERDVGHERASALAHTLDKGDAFGVEYNSPGVWRAAREGILAKIPDPSKDDLKLSPAWFNVHEAFDRAGRARSGSRAAVVAAPGPAEVKFLKHTTIGALVRIDNPSSGFIPDTLVRAMSILGSKGTRAEREDEGSPFRLAAERVRAALLHRHTTLSDAGLARRFCEDLHEQWLPPLFKIRSLDMHVARGEGLRSAGVQLGGGCGGSERGGSVHAQVGERRGGGGGWRVG